MDVKFSGVTERAELPFMKCLGANFYIYVRKETCTKLSTSARYIARIWCIYKIIIKAKSGVFCREQMSQMNFMILKYSLTRRIVRQRAGWTVWLLEPEY